MPDADQIGHSLEIGSEILQNGKVQIPVDASGRADPIVANVYGRYLIYDVKFIFEHETLQSFLQFAKYDQALVGRHRRLHDGVGELRGFVYGVVGVVMSARLFDHVDELVDIEPFEIVFVRVVHSIGEKTAHVLNDLTLARRYARHDRLQESPLYAGA